MVEWMLYLPDTAKKHGIAMVERTIRKCEKAQAEHAIADLSHSGKRARAAAVRLSPRKRRSEGARLLEALRKMFACSWLPTTSVHSWSIRAGAPPPRPGDIGGNNSMTCSRDSLVKQAHIRTLGQRKPRKMGTSEKCADVRITDSKNDIGATVSP